MAVTATSLLAEAAVDARAALAQCAAWRTWLGAADAAAAIALTHIVDTDDALSPPYALVTVSSEVPQDLGDELLHTFAVTVEAWVAQPAGAEDGAQDFVAGHNLEDVVRELRNHYRDSRADRGFDLTDVAMGEPVRGEPHGDANLRNAMAMQLVIGLEAVG